MRKLENKILFIPGGNSEIGKASALEAAKEGATIVIADLITKGHLETMKAIKAFSPHSMFIPLNVCNVESVKMAIQKTVEQYGKLDIAFNNAGIGGAYSKIHDLSESVWDKMIAANLTGQFYCIKYELQQFLKQNGGVIVNMSSLVGFQSEHGLVAHRVAKYGILGLTKNIAVQYAHQNIRANTICSYYVETPVLEITPEEAYKAWIKGKPMKRLCKPKEVAKAFVYLACDDSIDCNGTQLILDGGILA